MKIHSVKNWTRSDWGKNAATALLGGFVISAFNAGLLLKTLGDVIAFIGFICLAVWIYKKIRNRP
jgi:uncharacterized membrane protein